MFPNDNVLTIVLSHKHKMCEAETIINLIINHKNVPDSLIPGSLM